MPAVGDQDPVEALASDGADEPLSYSVCLRRSDWCVDRTDACGVPLRVSDLRRRLVVLVDVAAESVAAVDLAVAGSLVSLVGLGRPEFERTVRPLAVVVVDVDAEHVFEVTAVEDQQPVQALGTHGPHEAFCDRVRLRCAHGRLDDSDARGVRKFGSGSVSRGEG